MKTQLTDKNEVRLAAQKEVWRPVLGYESLYEVSSLGRIKSNRMAKFRNDGILKPVMRTGGYYCVCLFGHTSTKSCLIHRIVMLAFSANVQNKPEVNHLNGDKSDNRLVNLEWVTRKENSLHAYHILERKPSEEVKRGRSRRMSGTNNHKTSLTEDDVRGIRLMRGTKTSEVAAKYNTKHYVVRNIWNGITFKTVA